MRRLQVTVDEAMWDKIREVQMMLLKAGKSATVSAAVRGCVMGAGGGLCILALAHCGGEVVASAQEEECSWAPVSSMVATYPADAGVECPPMPVAPTTCDGPSDVVVSTGTGAGAETAWPAVQCVFAIEFRRAP